MSPIFVIGLFALLGFISFATFRTSQLLRTWQPEENILLVPFENLARLGLIADLIVFFIIAGVMVAAFLGYRARPELWLISYLLTIFGSLFFILFISGIFQKYNKRGFNQLILFYLFLFIVLSIANFSLMVMQLAGYRLIAGLWFVADVLAWLTLLTAIMNLFINLITAITVKS